jgi:Zn-dependent M16 (insulinase) family peptidase
MYAPVSRKNKADP